MSPPGAGRQGNSMILSTPPDLRGRPGRRRRSA